VSDDLLEQNLERGRRQSTEPLVRSQEALEGLKKRERSQEKASLSPITPGKYFDRLELMSLFYDIARTFMVSRELRPTERLESECQLPSTGDDFKGSEKAEIFKILRQRMEEHLENKILGARVRLQLAEQPGFDLFLERVRNLVEVFKEIQGVLGKVPPTRVVVGNTGGPKMTPDEEEAMIRVDAALKSLISIRQR